MGICLIMIQQLDHVILTSLSLYLDHAIQNQGSAFSNKSGLFYPDNSNSFGIYTYSCSYKQLCNDTSISGANIISGVYLNGVYAGVGTSGLIGINHYEGDVYFNQQLPKNTIVSGNFAVKEINVTISDQPDYKVVLNNKFASNPKYAQVATGISEDVTVFPAIILVPKFQETLPFAFAGIDNNAMTVRAMIVCETAWQRVGVGNILKNLRLKTLNLVSKTPFDFLGTYTGIPYNYNNLPFYQYPTSYIMEAKVTEIPEVGGFSDATKQFSMCDFKISSWGSHN